uniref:Uncharacterized protein n=1 Tax=Glossina palpalis gambiensis TaxID=67801 RepID=A0A1B0BNV1_9MUSC
MASVGSVGTMLIFNYPDLVNYGAVLIIGNLLNIQMRDIVCFQTGIAVVLKLKEEKTKKKKKKANRYSIMFFLVQHFYLRCYEMHSSQFHNEIV